jgi:hypothetical protein
MLKQEALDRILWRTHCGRGHGPVVRQATGGGDVQVHSNLVACSFSFTNHFHRMINTAFSVHYGAIKTLCGNNIVGKIINNQRKITCQYMKFNWQFIKITCQYIKINWQYIMITCQYIKITWQYTVEAAYYNHFGTRAF